MQIRCLIVDDSAAFRRAARVLLEREGITVVGVASASADAFRQVEALRPDVILVDVFLGTESGMELARQLVAEDLDAATVILISTHPEADLAGMIAENPAAGFIGKSDLSARAIRRIVERRAA